jgi:hypothetical protein
MQRAAGFIPAVWGLSPLFAAERQSRAMVYFAGAHTPYLFNRRQKSLAEFLKFPQSAAFDIVRS